MLVGQRISQIPPYGLQNYIAGILAPLERICHCDRHGLFTLSVLILNFAMKPLILPSLAPAVSTALVDLGTASISLGWQSFNFLVEPIQMGPIVLQLVDIGTLVFLFSIAVVMFFRSAA